MKNFNIPMLSLVLALAVNFAYAQRTMIIEPGGLNAIKTFIENDLASTDTATVEGTKYVLRRDATYPYETQWEPNYAIWLEAEEGPGARPRLLGVHPASGEAPRFIRVRDDFTFKGLFFAGLDSAGEHSDNAPIRPRGSGARVWVEDCLFDHHRFEVIRTDGVDQRVFFIDNIVRNNYQRDRWTKNGGCWFQRGNPVDTFVFAHNTYFNTTARLTHSINGAPIGYLEFSNNTVVNVGGLVEFDQYGGVFNFASLDMGQAQKVKVENNIFYNMSFFGIRSEWETQHYVFNYYAHDTITTSFIFRNNNIYTNPELLAGTPDTATMPAMFNPELQAAIDGDPSYEVVYENNISEPLTFTNAPMSIDILKQAKANRWNNPETSFLESLVLEEEPDNYEINYAYSTASQSATAGVDGNPLGSRRWMAMTSTKPGPEIDASQFAFVKVFPNPFHAQANVRFDLAQAAEVSMALYSLSGQLVRQLPSQSFPAGAGHNFELNAESQQLSQGIYFLRAIAEMDGRYYLATEKVVVK